MKSNLSRRRFLKQGSQGMVALGMIPYFLKWYPAKAYAQPKPAELGLNGYMDHFSVNETIINEVMSEALTKGGDYCDIYFQHTISNQIGLEDKAVNRAYSNVDYGVGIRVLKGDQTGYSFTEEITPKAMKLAAQTAANIARSGQASNPAALKLHKTPNYYPINMPWEDISIDKKIPILNTINEGVFKRDNRIVKSIIWFVDSSSYMLFANSEGRMVFDYKPMGLIYLNCTAEQNGKRETNGYNIGGRQGLEYMNPQNLDRLVNQAVSRTVRLFDAVKPGAGEMEVVLAAGSSGILLHEAIGHGMEADFNRKGISIFADKINKPVAKSFVSIVDDGTNLNARGSINVDDEGNDSGKTFLVENGTLRTYLHDRISSKYYNVEPTGSGRRESFRHPPLPRMRNTYMLPGPHRKEEIIGSVKKGIYAEAFTNGEVFIGAGDFTFYVSSGYLIENGKLTKPIKDINIIGNGPQVLKDIVMVSDDLKIDEGSWTCGKDGQSVPVSLGLPTVKVSKITVGGVNA